MQIHWRYGQTAMNNIREEENNGRYLEAFGHGAKY